MERLSPTDSALWRGETRQTHMQLATVAILQGPAPSYDELADRVAGLLHQAPRYRQRVLAVPLNLQREVWSDDEHFQLDYHLRHTALPAPGGHKQLRSLLGRIMTQQLDRSKPLWELWMVEGFKQNRWAIILKAHLSLVNGLEGQDLTELLLNDSVVASQRDWLPEKDPEPRQLLIEAAADFAVSPLEQLDSAKRLFRMPRDVIQRGVRLAVGSGDPAERSGLRSGPVGPHRSCEWVDLELPTLRSLATDNQVSTLEILLSLLSAGLRSAQQVESQLPASSTLATLVPLLAGTDLQDGGLRVNAARFDLPIGMSSSRDRIADIHRQMSIHRELAKPVSARDIMGLTGFAAARLLAVGLRGVTRAAQRNGNTDTVAIYVLGPDTPLSCMGREVIRLYPYAPLGERQRIAVAIYSYCDTLSINLTADRSKAHLLAAMADSIRAELSGLGAVVP